MGGRAGRDRARRGPFREAPRRVGNARRAAKRRVGAMPPGQGRTASTWDAPRWRAEAVVPTGVSRRCDGRGTSSHTRRQGMLRLKQHLEARAAAVLPAEAAQPPPGSTSLAGGGRGAYRGPASLQRRKDVVAHRQDVVPSFEEARGSTLRRCFRPRHAEPPPGSTSSVGGSCAAHRGLASLRRRKNVVPHRQAVVPSLEEARGDYGCRATSDGCPAFRWPSLAGWTVEAYPRCSPVKKSRGWMPPVCSPWPFQSNSSAPMWSPSLR